jgi:signal-transduction protein with cAMP-binding, CBS, and nucleotidyltransferase domain
MDQIKQDPPVDSTFNDRSVKEMTRPTKSVVSNASVEAALDEMRVRGVDSSCVVDLNGALLGSVSKDAMQRKVGGLGHDPKTEQVQAQLEKSAATCFDDQSVFEAKTIMLDANVGQVLVVTRAALLVGTTQLEEIIQQEHQNNVRNRVR